MWLNTSDQEEEGEEGKGNSFPLPLTSVEVSLWPRVC